MGGAKQTKLNQRSIPAGQTRATAEATNPHVSLIDARTMARAWAEGISNESRRLNAARAFVAASIESFARHDSARVAAPITLTPLPAAFTVGNLATSATHLAEAVGEAAAKLPVTEAAYLISVTYTVMLPASMRSRLGAYYTPPALTERLLDMATEAGVDWTTCRVLDPACGGGAFLAPAALRIVESLRGCEPAILLNNIATRLRGFEIDPVAAWMSQAFLEIALAPLCAAAGRGLPQLVTVCDALEQEPSTRDGFDLVIGNPPYGRLTLSPEQRARYRRSLYGHANLYGLFTDLALRWANPDGVIAYVTPTSFLAGEYFKALRGLLADEAPPVAVDFIADRHGVFEDVLQETMLATYRRGAAPGAARVHHVSANGHGIASVTANGTFAIPADPSEPWLLPRDPAHADLIRRLMRMRTRLEDWGYGVSTGPLVWNRHKDQLRTRAGRGAFPLIWAEAIVAPGRFAHRATRRNHEPYFEVRAGDDWLRTDRPCVLVQRTTAKEQQRRLIAAELPVNFIKAHGSVVIENHLNMVRPINGAPKVASGALAALLNSDIADRAFRCISGSVAVSAFELEALPLPTVTQMHTVERMLARGEDLARIETYLRSVYLGTNV